MSWKNYSSQFKLRLEYKTAKNDLITFKYVGCNKKSMRKSLMETYLRD